jgi:hypothetical protein
MTGTTPVVHSNPTNTEHRAALDTIFAAELKRRDAEAANTARALEGWRTKYRAERARVVGTDLQTQLDEYAAKYKTLGLQDGDGMTAAARAEEARKRRVASFRFAHDLGVNWAGLAALHEAASREVRDIVMPRRTTPTLGDVQLLDSGGTEPQPVPAPGQGPVARGRTSLMAPAPSAATFGPPYAWWDRYAENHRSGDGKIMQNNSYLWPEASRMGAVVWGQNYSAGNTDYLAAHRENGFLVPYTPDKTGIIEVQFDLQCAVCQHRIWLSNEWGWSDCTAWTNEAAVMSVFWSWEDYTPASETYDIGFVYGLNADGNGDHYPGTVSPAAPGQRRTVTLYTTSAFPAGAPLWLYVGSRQRLFAWLNDVSINVWLNSAWYVTGIRVRVV